MIIISSIAVATLLGFGFFKSNAAQAEPKLTQAEIEAMVQAQYPGTIKEIELEKGFNKVVYEVEVHSNGKEYEIKFDGNTGEVLKLEEKQLKATAEGSSNLTISEKNDATSNNAGDNSEYSSNDQQETDDSTKDDSVKDDDVTNNKQSDDNQSDDSKQNINANNQNQVVIDFEKAKEIALAQFAGTIKELKLDEDDGRLIYEVEMEGVAGEAELDIDAYTGEIISISIDADIGVSVGDDDDDED